MDLDGQRETRIARRFRDNDLIDFQVFNPQTLAEIVNRCLSSEFLSTDQIYDRKSFQTVA